MTFRRWGFTAANTEGAEPAGWFSIDAADAGHYKPGGFYGTPCGEVSGGAGPGEGRGPADALGYRRAAGSVQRTEESPMRQARVLVFILTAVLLTGGWLWGQPSTTKGKGSLPPYWKSIGLSDEQKQKAMTIRSDYKTKIDALKQQIIQLEKQEKGELEKILTEDQKKQLQKIIASKVPGGEGSKEEDKKSEDKKSGEKKP
jgi:hypothetical protein